MNDEKQPIVPLAKANEYVMEQLVAALDAHDAFSRPEPMTRHDGYSERPNRVGVFFGSSGFAMIEVVAVGGGVDMLSPERQAETRAYAEKLAERIRAGEVGP